MTEDVTKDNVLDYIIKCAAELDALDDRGDRGILVSQPWFTQVMREMDAIIWCNEQIAAMSAAAAALKFKRNSSYWPEYSTAPALNMLDIFKK